MRLLKEPLLHFFLIGAVLFFLHGGMNRKSGIASRLVVSAEKIAELTADFSNDWNREPSPQELDALISDTIREELAYQEGLERGLDQNDPVIRQRIRQKLEFMVEEQAPQRRPSDEERYTDLRSAARSWLCRGAV